MDLFARYVSLQDNGETQIIGFADDESNPIEYVLLQRAKRPTERDKQLGHDQVHIIISDESRSAYGGLSKIFLFSDRLIIELNENTAKELKSQPQINIELEVQYPPVNDMAVRLDAMTTGQCSFQRLI